MNNHDSRYDCNLTKGTHFTKRPSVAGEPVQFKGFSVTYDRRFAMGNLEYVHPAITLWLERTSGEDEPFDLHHAKERVRRMARENVRAQLLRVQGKNEVVFLGLQPPLAGGPDPILVQTVCLSLIYSINLGDENQFSPGYTDWADLRSVAHHPGELHMALARLWQSLWANIEDELARARGEGGSNGFFGLQPKEEVVLSSDLTARLPFLRFSQLACSSGNGVAINRVQR